jgi:hypothetical protein
MTDIDRDFPTAFSEDEQRLFAALRERYLEDPGLFTRGEWNELRFLRWLYTKGYFDPKKRDRMLPVSDAPAWAERTYQAQQDVA